MKAVEFKGLAGLKWCIGHMCTAKTLPSFTHPDITDIWKFGSWPMDWHAWQSMINWKTWINLYGRYSHGTRQTYGFLTHVPGNHLSNKQGVPYIYHQNAPITRSKNIKVTLNDSQHNRIQPLFLVHPRQHQPTVLRHRLACSARISVKLIVNLLPVSRKIRRERVIIARVSYMFLLKTGHYYVVFCLTYTCNQ